MGLRTLVPLVATLFLACGTTDDGTGKAALPGADAGATLATTGGATGSSGASAAGGNRAAGAGGATPGGGGASAAGKPGAGGAAIDCSNVGCGAPPLCGKPCGSPCGCCPCAEGERNGATVCVGGCYAPASDASAGCNPTAEEHRRKYVGTSPAACQTIRFACPPNTTMFSNACGCGCEQKASCPEWFSCEPGPQPACDTQQIKTDCPYSGIAF